MFTAHVNIKIIYLHAFSIETINMIDAINLVESIFCVYDSFVIKKAIELLQTLIIVL